MSQVSELPNNRESIHELSQRCHKINKFPKSRAGGINKRAAGRGPRALNSGPRATGFTGRTPDNLVSRTPGDLIQYTLVSDFFVFNR